MRSETPIFTSMVQQHTQLLDLRSRLTEVPAHQLRPFPFLYEIPAIREPRLPAVYEPGHPMETHFVNLRIDPWWVPDVRGKASN
jgi:hypothetical protein